MEIRSGNQEGASDMDKQMQIWGEMMKSIGDAFGRFVDTQLQFVGATLAQAEIAREYWNGVFKYSNEFMYPYWIAQDAFLQTEQRKVRETPLWETVRDYLELLRFNLQIVEKGGTAALRSMTDYHLNRMTQAFQAFLATAYQTGDSGIASVMAHEAKLLEKVVHGYAQSILEIEPEYGFHFERDGYRKVAETDRFTCYQVLPEEPGVAVNEQGKPVLIVHPYVLGANILAFLPGEKKSYVHAFANQGVPTYVRIMKDITTTPAVQTMTGEDDALDTRGFCEALRKRHGKPVTLNGFCQGGFIAAAILLSGELDGLVDALITCVTPMDGTRSKALVEYLEHLPPRFRDLGYAVKTLPNGNRVVDGQVMSWVYKLKSMEKEAPLVSLYRDLLMFDRPDGKEVQITKTAAAINYWLLYDRNDLPEAITQMSFRSYTVPITSDGTLPVTLFGRPLNFKRLAEKGQKLLICYAEKDDLVDKETALAPLDFVDAEVTVFPKGHGAIATSWSDPTSECALHKRFGKQGYRGPVRFHLDLE